MSTLNIYDSYFDDSAKGNLIYSSITVKCMLVTSSYTFAKTHAKRSDITNEIAASGGYSAGGFTATCSQTSDTTNHRLDVSLGGSGATYSTATITARGAVYYRSRGGASSADELIAFVDFGSDVTSTGAAWTLTSTTLRIQN